MLVLDKISIGYGGAPLLTGFSLTVEEGETVCLTAPSGIGKTTLLRTAAGLLPPIAGRVENSFSRTAFAFQEERLLPWLSTEQNLLFTLPGGASRQEALNWLELLELPKASWSKRPAELSGGMQKRVNLARALATDPDLLILDEPFNSLDEGLARRCWEKILLWQKRKHAAILAVSHSLELFQAARIIPLSPSPSH